MRKKITMLFAALLACVGVMKAETETITSLSAVKENTSYVIYTNEGGLIANQEGTNVTATSIANFDKSANASQFAFIEQDGEYYLWSISASKFLANDGSFVSTATPQAIEFVQLDGNWSGRVRMRFDGNHNININSWRNSVVIDGWSLADEGTAYYVEVAKEGVNLSAAVEMLSASVEVTYIYKYNDIEVARKTKTQDNNSAYSAPAIDYVTFAYPDEKPVSENNKEVVVTCTENLPFEKSESFEKAKWYIVDMHSNDNGAADISNGSKKYVWTYNGEDYDKSNVQLPKEDSKQTSVFGDDKMWCFVGDVFNGFKIYNKAAGEALTLNKATDGNNVAGMSNAASATLYTLVPGSINGSTCFLPKNHSYYLNAQKEQTDLVKFLQGWDDADGGSSCRFFAPTYFVKDLLDDYLIPAGVVTAPEALTDDMSAVIRTAYDAVAADGWNTAAITAEVTTALEALKGSEVIALSEGYYFIKGTGVGNNATWYLTHKINNDRKCLWANVPSELNADYVWKFESYEDGYKIQSVALGKYFQLKTATNGGDNNTYIESDVEAGEKFLLTSSEGKFSIKNSNGENIRTEGSGQVNYWSGEKNESWYLVPLTDEEMSLCRFVAKVGTEYYNTLQGAIEAAEAEETVKLLDGITLTEATEINKVVTLNRNGKTITRTGEGYAFEVTGELILEGAGSIDGGIHYIINDNVYKQEEKAYAMSANKGGVDISYIRNFGHTNWQVLYVPFNIPIASMGEFDVYSIAGANSNAVVVDQVTEGTTLAAHTPYLIKAKSTGEKTIFVENGTLETAPENDYSQVKGGYTFTGTYAARAITAETEYVLTGGKWCQLDNSSQTLSAFRVYLTVAGAGASAPELRITTRGEEDTTAIDNAEFNAQPSAVIYDLLGRRVEKMDKGIYIVNGKKIVVK